MQPFIIPLNGLAQGRTSFCLRADGEFFNGFENSEILEADVQVDVTVEKSGRYIGVDCGMLGDVTVECDRCLAELVLPVDTQVKLSVKFGQEASDDAVVSELGREILFLPETDTDLDLSQVVYDYICLSLPMLRVHPEGECDPHTVKYLSSEETEAPQDAEPLETPFMSLKSLLEKNNI